MICGNLFGFGQLSPNFAKRFKQALRAVWRVLSLTRSEGRMTRFASATSHVLFVRHPMSKIGSEIRCSTAHVLTSVFQRRQASAVVTAVVQWQ